MAKRRNKIIVKTNLDTATPEEKERFMKNLVEAHMVLYKSVVERKTREMFTILFRGSTTVSALTCYCSVILVSGLQKW